MTVVAVTCDSFTISIKVSMLTFHSHNVQLMTSLGNEASATRSYRPQTYSPRFLPHVTSVLYSWQ